ncbi:MAG: DUF4438 domain-containing protein [Candidatus Jettenia sp.]|uniref:DUF4438 domain-containing protein n=1 Tax=Candidatus Jettenia caeni TaxID=247490 RepID=I3IIP2_9BACT|nr:DUF4438 domain-containing protein [Candidatus Jettenia sp. AMX1]KAA0243541.1 MAG: DUF4438 domain-containing protein [Candidatus Brocadia sp. AMX2]MBC6930248.1 DUF4438 domain-containing protein [Candidatus Jettenia sp.]WKZ16903.1 MAG: DUF4438 domain-containing protein [Candidatus Jettenia caeni]MCQ3927121.1 DUF4438 domain-containing protein [Candidatus Jettenia sp.]MDL1939855.1 DUF4438 domain-containing protein [Candidatus Jettenia sp. AMX1]
METNEKNLVEISVVGEITSPIVGSQPYSVTPEGKPVILPSVGGITYNVKVGDSAIQWEADHVEPCVSVKNKDRDENGALNLLSCIGNTAKVITGDAKGSIGIVTGKHGGIENVLVDFEDKILEKLTIGDKILIRSVGLGLSFIEYPHIKPINISPNLLKVLPIRQDKTSGILHIPVTHAIPAAIMGSGLGSQHCCRGDYDIQLFDKEHREKYHLQTLRFGDIVAIMDADHTYGRIYKTGAISIGVIVHSNCVTAGHGPGVTTLLTSAEGKIIPYIDAKANISFYLNIGRFRKRSNKKDI